MSHQKCLSETSFIIHSCISCRTFVNMKDEIEVDQECEPFSTMVQLVNEICSSFTSDQVTTCFEGNGCFLKNIPSYLDKSNTSSLHINAAIINKVNTRI